MINEITQNAYVGILKEELMSAMGCTEPIAIAYAAAILSDALGEMPKSVKAGFSGNIIKNVKSVIVPMTGGKHGIEAAIAAGLLSKAPEIRLEVLTALPENASELIDKLLLETEIDISELGSGCAFELRISAYTDGKYAEVRIEGDHTNVTAVSLSGEDITSRYCQRKRNKRTGKVIRVDRNLLNVEDIVEFADTVDLSELRPYLLKQIETNMAIAKEGLTGNWGASIGKLLLSYNEDVRRRATAYAAAGSDARMSGCEMPVTIISGSGNQGITASVPVAVYAEELGASEELLLRSLIISDLITVHQKTGIGTLSAYCGAVSAGVGAGAGICYMHGGRFYEIAHTVVNAVAILSGTICDGAKPSCAAKIAMAVEAGIMGFEMSRVGKQFLGGDGIITKGVENTIKNVGRLAKDGMKSTDEEIIKIMLNK